MHVHIKVFIDLTIDIKTRSWVRVIGALCWREIIKYATMLLRKNALRISVQGQGWLSIGIIIGKSLGLEMSVLCGISPTIYL